MSSLIADPKQIKIHMNALGIKDEERNIFQFLAEDPTKTYAKPVLTFSLNYSEALEYVAEAISRGYACHMLINKSRSWRRIKKDIILVRAVFQEDDGDGRDLPLKPNLVIYSGGITADGRRKKHSYLFTQSMTLEEFELFMQNIVENWGSDKAAKDCSRVLRLAGTYHFKTGTPRPCVIAEYNPVPYSKEELFEAFRMKDFLVQKEAKKSHAPRTNIGNASSPLPKTIMSRSEIARLRDAVMTINPDCSYDEWIRVGMGLRYELGEGGFELWDLWSSSGQKYKQHEMRSKWESFNA